ncbi:hypothetical protein DFS34DRAFT_598898 [Phlyctochytrium arcticum]|nr:hypothetical protein DFS34DRAFT_598898 [Phlyctochytrium arcticum]
MATLPVPGRPLESKGEPLTTFSKTIVNRQGHVVRNANFVRNAVHHVLDKSFLTDVLLAAREGTSKNDSGDAQLEVMVSLDDERFLDDDRYSRKTLVAASHFYDRLWGDEGEKIDKEPRQYFRGRVPPSLWNELDVAGLMEKLYPLTDGRPTVSSHLTRIWVSSAGSVTPLHYDRCHGVLIQLRGRKRFTVFPRDDAPNCYLQDGVSAPRHASKIRGIDRALMGLSTNEEMETLLQRFPKISRTEPYSIELEPGDILYTPPGFLHEVTSLTSSMSVTLPWDMSLTELDDRPAFMAF